jgi:catechol 2,3-dioxygenase-like lactoylglutathione lyase family enzyme
MGVTMARVDHVAVESTDPDGAAAFYERFLGARIVRTEGHPVMAYVQGGALAIHAPGRPGPHIAFRVSEEDRAVLKRRLEDASVDCHERDHEIAVGLFFRDPDGRLLEAITYRSGGDPRRPQP